MSAWTSLVPFMGGNFDTAPVYSNVTPSVNSGLAGTGTNPFGAPPPAGGGTPPKPGGPSTPPPITLLTDYWLRDQTNEVITDQSGAAVSLQGLEF
jgi:hypothetical protein